MIYNFFKRSAKPPLQIMSASQAHTLARAKYRERFAEEIEAIAAEIKDQANHGQHTIDVDHSMDAAMATEVATYFRAIGYGVESGHQTLTIHWLNQPEKK